MHSTTHVRELKTLRFSEGVFTGTFSAGYLASVQNYLIFSPKLFIVNLRCSPFSDGVDLILIDEHSKSAKFNVKTYLFPMKIQQLKVMISLNNNNGSTKY